MTKTLEIPFIPSLETLDSEALDLILEERGAKACIGSVNWPDAFPYMPDCNVTAAHDGKNLALMFHVRGLDLRAMETADNGRIWEDSCVEFFVQDATGNGEYHNFELNCAGVLLAAHGKDRHERPRHDTGTLKSIKRYTSIKGELPFQKDGGIFSWKAGMLIPLEIFGASSAKELRGNFYKCGDLTAHKHFVSWATIDLPKPDFHRPDFFGNIILK